MRFLRRHPFLLCFLAVTIFSSIMVVRQFRANESAHVERLEDFLLLQEREQVEPSQHFYQVLIQDLPNLSDKSLVDDLRRTTMVVDPKIPDLNSLVWKYYVSVKNELHKRADRRLARALEEAKKP